MTQNEFQALEKIMARLTLQLDDVSAKVGQLTTSQQLIEQRLVLDRSSAARETELIKALAAKETEMAERLSKVKTEVKESSFTFHLRVLSAVVVLLAVSSFPQLITVWKTLKGFAP